MKYNKPEIAMIKFDVEDIITSSSANIDGGNTSFSDSWIKTNIDGQSVNFSDSWVK